jgi:hypothetical protein
MRLMSLIFSTFALLVAAPGMAQQQDMDHMVFKVGEVYYFGYGGMDLSKLQTQMPLKVGDSFRFASFDEAEVKATVIRATGKPPTDISKVCCDQDKHVIFYLGLAGTTSRPLPPRAAPTGAEHLAPAAAALYSAEMAALGPAMAAGRSGEDDSRGYALANDPALHGIQMKMRAYALTRETTIERVLKNASDVKQRWVAAALLGYSRRSAAQVRALERAMLDPDGETRNNAIRSLAVLASARDAAPLDVNPEPLIALLYSGKWTDRNKASFLLSRITEKDTPVLLKALRQEAIPALTEGACWDEGHGLSFVTILGRMFGVSSGQMKEMIAAGACCSERR